MRQIEPEISQLEPQQFLDNQIWEPCCDHEKCVYPMHYCLRPEIRRALLRISNEFFIFLGIDAPVDDVTFTGSMANFNYTQMSDIDLHLIINFSNVDENHTLVKDFFNAKKSVWNESHNIKIKGHDVELYVQGLDEPHHSTGVFSVLKNKWIVKPEKKRVVINKRAIKQKAQCIMSDIDLALQSPNRKIILDKIKEKIKNMRSSGLERAGEFSVENLAFKVLRRNGYLEKLYGTSREDFDRSLSVDD